MPYDVPTVQNLVARYPAFATVPVDTVALHIADAAGAGVDTSWREADYGPAICALAAHNMALLGLGDIDETQKYAAAGVNRIRSGNFDASFSESRVKAASSGGFDATVYGRLYKTMLRRNRAGPRIIGPGSTALQNDGGILPWAS